MDAEMLVAAADVLHLSLLVVKAVRSEASAEEIRALAIAADKAREDWERAVLRSIAARAQS